MSGHHQPPLMICVQSPNFGEHCRFRKDAIGSSHCAGQFGTRLQGGKDAAGARYIMTRLDKIARVVFHEHDDKLLGYLKEEGQSIEPQWCAPASTLYNMENEYTLGDCPAGGLLEN